MAANGERFWIVDGAVIAASHDIELSEITENERFERRGGVRVTTGLLGTEIKWCVFSPSYGYIFKILQWLPTVTGPFFLRFYISGWFEESYETSVEAINRIEEILAKSELRITKRAFVKEIDEHHAQLPKVIGSCIDSKQIIPDISIDCVLDERTQKFRVNRVGAQSLIARIYGVVPVTYPFVYGGSYDDIVCEAYKDVLNTGKPRYDHVLAAMRLPNNVVHWLPYQRWIVPKSGGGSTPTVTVVSENASVDIKPV